MITNNLDGTPLNSSQKSSAVKANKSSMADITSALSSASSYYDLGNSLMSSAKTARSSASADPFTVYSQGDDISMFQRIRGISMINHQTLTKANSLTSAYQNLDKQNNTLINGTLGEQLAKDDQSQRAEQSQRALRVRVAYDPSFSASYSASQSASASFADLPQSKQSSLLNSLAADKRTHNMSNSDNGTIDSNWTLPDYNNGGNNQ